MSRFDQPYVYFVKPIGADGPIKIGHSTVPQERLMALSVWSPWPLELVGTFPGGSSEERALHQAFADLHTHREWFRTSPRLREVIAKILTEGWSAAKTTLEPKAPVRKSPRIVRSKEHEEFLELHRSVSKTEKNLRAKGDDGAWSTPEDVRTILSRWARDVYGNTGFSPSDADMLRVKEYLADPVKHSVIPYWREGLKEKMAAAASAAEIDRLASVSVPHMVEELS
jgi:hypothetical protein